VVFPTKPRFLGGRIHSSAGSPWAVVIIAHVPTPVLIVLVMVRGGRSVSSLNNTRSGRDLKLFVVGLNNLTAKSSARPINSASAAWGVTTAMNMATAVVAVARARCMVVASLSLTTPAGCL